MTCTRHGSLSLSLSLVGIRHHFKDAGWQLEAKPGNGALHYQGRGSLYKKIRPGKGNAGKSSLLQYLHYYDIAFDLQPFGSVKELMQYAYGFTHKKGYVLNFPKAVDAFDERQRYEFTMMMAGLEGLKDGRAVDGRNHPRPPIHFPSPNMLLLMNTKFPLGLVSIDRYTFFAVGEAYELLDITEQMLMDYKQNSRDYQYQKEKERIMKEYQRDLKEQKFLQQHSGDMNLMEKFRAAERRAGYQLDDQGRRIVGGREPIQLPPRQSPLLDLAARSRSPPPCPASSSSDMPAASVDPTPTGVFVFEESERRGWRIRATSRRLPVKFEVPGA